MTKERHIGQNDYPEALLLSGEWEDLSPGEQRQLEKLKIDREQFTTMRALLLEAAVGADSAIDLQAPPDLKENLLNHFEEVHGKSKPLGKVVVWRRRRLFLAGVAASLAFLLMAAGAIFFTDNRNPDQHTTPVQLAQNKQEQKESSSDHEETVIAKEALTSTPEGPKRSSASGSESLPVTPPMLAVDETPARIDDATATPFAGEIAAVEMPEKTDAAMEIATWTRNSAKQTPATDTQLTFSLSQAEQPVMLKETQKAVTGVRTETTPSNQPKTATQLPAARPASKDAALFGFLYACK